MPPSSAALASFETKAPTIGELPRLTRLRAALLDAPYGLCTQKAELLTEALERLAPLPAATRALGPLHLRSMQRSLERSLGTGQPSQPWQLTLNRALQTLWLRLDERQTKTPMVLLFAEALAQILARVELRVYPDELLVGNPTRHRIGAALHPDYGALLLLPELDELDRRPLNPLRTSPEQIAALRDHIYPRWFTRAIMSRAPLLSTDPNLQNELTSGRRMVLTQFAGIAHVTPDFPRILERGFLGILADVQAAREQAQAPEQRDFLDAASVSAKAVIELALRLSETVADQAARCDDPARKAELLELAQICARVPAHPARSFHEALQSVVSTWMALHQESFQHGVSLGRVDQYLWPYYARDRDEGRIDRARAVELLGCLLGKAAEQLPLFNGLATEFFSGLSSASGLTLGGVDEHGKDASNELTELILLAYDRMRLRQPNIHLRVHEGTPQWLWSLAAEQISAGGGMPALFNDAQIIPAIAELHGLDRACARDYAIVGCVEWGLPYRSFPAAGAGFLSLPAALDEALHELAGEPGEPGEPSMDQVWARFEARLGALVDEALAGNDAIEQAHARWRPTPLLSLCVRGCIEAGADVTAGGAQFNSTGVQAVGLADVADSLTVIEQLVITERALSLAQLVAHCDDNFAGPAGEALRQRARTKVPKYGQDRGRPEWWASRIVARYCELIRAHPHPRGGVYAPGLWTMTTHVGFGARQGALPSGRKRGEPLANGASPTQGSDALGPTASLLAVARVATPALGNGLALNETLDRNFVRSAGPALIESLSRGYFDAGGMQVQYNVLDVEELIDAQLHPERHRGLVVRVSGYSAYFADLSAAMQDEIIARQLHGCAEERGR